MNRLCFALPFVAAFLLCVVPARPAGAAAGGGQAAAASSPAPAAAPIITRAELEAREAELEAGVEQAKANLHATEGALEECQRWLAQLDREAAAQEKGKAPPAPAANDDHGRIR